MSTTTEIFSSVKSALGSRYTVLTSYDASDEVDPSGSLAVDIVDTEYLNHTDCEDYRFGVRISGFTTSDEDKDRSIIMAMADYVMNIGISAIKSGISGCVGIVKGQMSRQSDGDSNEFTMTYDIYVCDAIFTEPSSSSSSSSSSVDDTANDEGQI